MPESPDFILRLQTAVDSARDKLGRGFTLNADRAGAYLDISNVLMSEANALAGSDPDTSQRYLDAARMIQEQAEITTYSGENGVAAITGNLRAKLNNPETYSISLDEFSFLIDDSILRFFEGVADFGDIKSISKNNILAVDGMTWDRLGLLDYFPGNAISYSFDADLTSSVWLNASAEQRMKLYGTEQQLNPLTPKGLAALIELGAAIGFPQVYSLGKNPSAFGFTDPSEIASLQIGNQIVRDDIHGKSWKLIKSSDGIVSIVDNMPGSPVYGHTAYIDNGYEMATGGQQIGLVLAGILFPATLYRQFAEVQINPETGQEYYTLTPESVDKIKNFMGADYGLLGARFGYAVGQSVLTQEDLQQVSTGGGKSGSHISYITDPNNADVITIIASSPSFDGNGTRLASVELGKTTTGSTVINRSVVIELTSSGTLASAEISDADQVRILNLAEAARIQDQIADFAKRAADQEPKLIYGDLGELIGVDDQVTGGGQTSDIGKAFLTAKVDANGNLTLEGHTTKLIAFDPRSKVASYQISAGVDEFGREVTQKWSLNLENDQYKYSGKTQTVDGVLTVTQEVNGPTTIRLTSSPVHMDFVDGAQIISSTFGRYIAGDDVLTQTLTTATLNTIAANFGDVLNTLAFDSGIATSDNLSHAFDGIDAELLDNIKSAGIGAVSSFLSAQLVGALGIGGVPSELLNTAAGQAINVIINNLSNGAYVFQDLSRTSITNAAGSYVGNKLASEIADWDEVGEQIGAQIGSAIGATLASGIPVIGTAIGAFFGNLIGGLIGGIFTGAPKSGAILGFDEATGRFQVETVWEDDGGKHAVARQLGNTAATSLNGILATIGGELLNGDDVDAGSYGMRKKAFVYWNDGTSSDDRIKFATASDLVEYGVMKGAGDMQIIGGDIYAKRAFYLTMAQGAVISSNGDGTVSEDGLSSTNVDYGLDLLVGNLAVADRLKIYLANSASINALIAAEPDSVFTSDWLIALSRASELGLLKRNTHDWDGGFSYLLSQGDVDARDVGFRFETSSRQGNGARVMYLDDGALEDTVDTGSKTIIHGGGEDDVLTALTGGNRDGAAAGTAYHITNVFHGGAGDDRIVAGNTGDDLFGDEGDDILVGGQLDDWLFGGTGNDVLYAGGGSGNVLIAGSGDDQLIGADGVSSDPMDSGSDWLLGGLGNDRLNGQGGDDYFEAGKGNDSVEGGAGNDTIIFRTGDGHDQLNDSGTSGTERDVLEFGERIAASDITVVAHSAGIDLSLLVGGAASDDRIDLRGAVTNIAEGIEEVSFASGNWSKSDLAAHVTYAKSAGSNLRGTSADETLTGTLYDDTVTGGGGHDILSGRDGSDTYIFNLGDGEVAVDDVGAAVDIDAVQFGAGITLANLSIGYDPTNPYDIILTIGSSGDKLILKHQDVNDGSRSIEELRFADGTSLTFRDLYRLGTGPSFNGTVQDAATVSWDQTLGGGDGPDSFSYNSGDGNVRINESYWSYKDTLVLGTGIRPEDLVITRDPQDPRDVWIRFNGMSGSVLLNDQDSGAGTGIEHIQFADGTTWDRTILSQKIVDRKGTVGGELIYDGQSSTVISAGAGDDIVYAGSGADMITGGQGDDDLNGGDGGNTYVYNIGDGNDRIVQGYWEDGIDTLSFGAGIGASDLVLTRNAANGSNMRISFADHPGSILLQGQSDGRAAGIEQIQFADGTTWDRAAIDARVVADVVSSGNDIVRDGYFSTVINAGAGNDVVYAGGGADTITGGTGDDDLYGSDGGNTYVYNVGDGNDRITQGYWEDGLDTLSFGTGIAAGDLILTRDVLDTGNVTIAFANNGGSILLQGQFGGRAAGIEQIQFADGTTWDRAAIDARVVADVVSSGNDIVRDGYFSTVINAGAGNDVVYAGGGADTITGGTGDDDLYGSDGGNTYVYNVGDGNDRITQGYWEDGLDTLSFGTGIAAGDLILTRDVLDTGNVTIAFANNGGSILLQGQFGGRAAGIEQIQFADGTTWDRAAIDARVVADVVSSGNDIVRDGYFSTVINAGAGNDVVYAGGGADTITGGTGDDDLYGSDGGNTYVYNVGDGNDRITQGYWEDGLDTLSFGTGIAAGDLILTRDVLDTGNVTIAFANNGGSILLQGQFGGRAAGIEQIQFADGTTWDRAAIDARVVADVVSSGNDIVRDGYFSTVINAGAGNDVVYAGGGADTITGGTGDDDLYGSDGGNTYVYNVGDGNDRITQGYWEDGLDTLSFGTGIAAGDLILTRDVLDTGNVTIAFANNGGSILLQGQFGGRAAGIEQIQFADGTTWDRAGIEAHVSARASDLTGTNGSNVLTGTAGQDQIYGYDGDDTLRGGTGNDFLAGGGGDDTYVLNRGDGADTVYDDSGSDTLRFGAGITIADLVLLPATTDGDVLGLFIGIAGTGDRVYIRNQNANNGRGIERFEFADGTVLSDADMRARLVTSTAGADRLYGTPFADQATGGAGNDEVNTGDGNDTLTGGKGNDYLNGQGGDDVYVFNRGDGSDTTFDDWGSDTLRFGAGISASDLNLTVPTVDNDFQGLIISIAGTSDRIYLRNQNSNNGHGIERFEFADGTVLTDAALRTALMAAVVTDGDDKIYGTNYADTVNGGNGDDEITSGDGNDVLTGGKGNDYLNGQGGDDVYVFNRGDGSDTTFDDWGSDTLRFGAGISASDLNLTVPTVDNDFQGLIISIAGTSDRIYLRNQNSNNGHGIERFEFADGTVLTDAALRTALMAAVVTDGDDKIYGTNYADTVNGGNGDDEITSGDGNDVLTGGKGNDYLNGQGGDDVYVFNRGDGSDTTFDDWGSDTLRFGAGISASDLNLTVPTVDNDFQGLIISIAGTSDRIYLRNQNSNNGHGIERFEFADGTVLTDAALRTALMVAVVTDGDDKIYGTNYADAINGGNGDDEIASGDGNDVLTGGKGNDYLNGQGNDDTYVYNRGDGSDTIVDDWGYDTLQLGEGIDESDIVVSRALTDSDGNGIMLSIKGTDDRIYLRSEFDGNRIDLIRFQSGATWNVNTLLQLLRGTTIDGSTVAVTMGDDTIIGAATNDNIRGMKGDDVLRGGAGSDTYSFARGDGHDTIYDPTDPGSTETLVLEGINPGDVRVFMSPTDAQDLILYIDDDNVIYLDQQNVSASSGIEQVRFADGTIWTRDMLTAKASGGQGTAGNDTLIGTNFSDTLAGGLGNDTLTGSGGNDTYVYNIGDGDDTIVDDNGAGSDPSQPGNAGNVDTLSFGAGISLADVRLTQPTPDGPLVISFASQPGSITLKGLNNGGRSGVELLRFADGSTVTMDQLRASSIDAAATTGDDLIRGFGTNDTLDGGAGNDTLAGGGGSDTYLFDLGDGTDTIVETADGAINKLAFGSGIAIGDIRLVRTATAPDDLVLLLSNGTDKVTIKSQFANSSAAGLELIQFADGTVWLAKDFETILLAQPATAGADYLAGNDNTNTIDGLAGDDVILGGGGDDTLHGSDGNDILYGGVGDDKLYGGAGDDILSGDTGTDLLDGDDGFDIADYSFSLDNWSIDLAAGTAKIVTSQNSAVIESLTGIEGVIGGLGSDTITGNDGANQLEGGGGNDTLNGGGGNDAFVFDGNENGVDAVDGGAGYDRIEAASDDTVIGLASLANVELVTAQGHANVTIETTDDADTLDLSGTQIDNIASINLGGGNDVITSSLGADVINVGDGDDIIRYVGASTGGDQVDGGAGYDTIAAGADNTIIRLASFQNVEAIAGNGFANIVLARTDDSEVTDLNGIAVSGLAYIDLAGGDDTFVGTAQADMVRGGAGDDHLTGAGGDDVFQYATTESGFDTINGGAGYDRLQAATNGAVIGIRSIANIEAIDGNSFTGVTIATGDGDDHLDLNGITLTGIAGIVGGKGNDVLRGSGGDDTFLVSGADQGLDDFDGAAGQDRILAGADGTVISVRRIASIEMIDGGGHANIHLETTDGNDSLSLQGVTLTGISEINLGMGDDSFAGSSASDTISGGLGNDILSGGAGDDVYLFKRGDGNDTINEAGGSGTDTVQFGAGIAAGDVIVSRTRGGEDLLLSLAGGGSITLYGTLSGYSSYRVEQVRFDDGTVWDHAALLARVPMFTGGDDQIDGDDDANTLSGGAGNDTLYARGGNDILIGGTGNDTLSGMHGDDIYRYELGDGNDTVSEEVYGVGAGSGNDTVQFGAGIATGDVTVTKVRGGEDILLSVAGGGSVTLFGTSSGYSSYRVEQVRFDDGTVWDHAALLARVPMFTSGDDQITGDDNANTLSGGAGNDTLYARGGNDILIGGTGNDTLSGMHGDDIYRYELGDGNDTVSEEVYGVGAGSGNDTVQFGAGIATGDVTVSRTRGGEDLLLSLAGGGSVTLFGTSSGYGSYRVEQVRFDDGTVWDHAALMSRSMRSTSGDDQITGDDDANTLSGLGGNDTLYGQGGNDILIGGTGNDTLSGMSGDDVYRYELGDGNDTVNEAGGGGNDTVQFGAGIATSDVTVSQARGGEDLLLSLAGGGSVTLFGTSSGYGSYRVEQVRFDDGTVWDHAALMSRSMRSTSGDDQITGDDDANTLSGLGGNDTLYGRGGNDILIGGTGNDTLSGMSGDDVYRYELGDGNDTVNEAGGGGNDTVQFGAGIATSDVTVSQARGGEDLLLSLAGGGSVTLFGTSSGYGSYRVEQVRFDDGTVWDHAALMALSMRSTSGDDQIYGDDDANTVSGGAGNDTLYGRGGNDILIGGTGNDTLSGMSGDDVYRYELGDGNDTVNEAGGGGSDTVQFGAGIATSDITVSQARGGEDLLLSLAGGGSVALYATSSIYSSYRVEQVRFNDNTVWDHAALMALATATAATPNTNPNWIVGDAGANELTGTSGNDTLQGRGGNDYLAGRFGSDVYIYKSGDGADTIYEQGVSSGDVDILQLIDLSPADVTLRSDGMHVWLLDGRTGSEIMIQYEFYDSTSGLEQVTFADGMIWDRAAIYQHLADWPVM